MKKFTCAAFLSLAFAAAGCGFEQSNHLTGVSTSPSDVGVSALMGTWASVTAASGVIPSPSSCTDFKWNATQQTATAAAGSFSATCAGGLNVVGTAQGTLSGSTITWSATGTATTSALPSCAISLTGTAELGVDSIRVPYSGTTCLGPVSGVEILNRH